MSEGRLIDARAALKSGYAVPTPDETKWRSAMDELTGRMHGQKRHADVDSLDTQARSRQRTNRAAAGHGVGDKFLGCLPGLQARLEP